MKRTTRNRTLWSCLMQRPGPEDVQSVLTSSLPAALAGSANALLYVLATWPSFSAPFLTVWCAASLSTNIYTAIRSNRARSVKVERVSRRAARRLLMFVVLLAAPWGVLAAITVLHGTQFDLLMMTIVCAGNMAGASFMLHRTLLACTAYYLVILVPMSVTFLVFNADEFWPVVVYGLLFGSFLITSSRKTGEIARQRDSSVAELSKMLSELETAYQTISELAFFDPVTDLPNRKAFLRRLDEVSTRAIESGEGFAFLMLDLDRFKNVNDTLGHAVGDRLLARIAERLRMEAGPDDMLARLGGDEFALLLTTLPDPEELGTFATGIIAHLNAPTTIDNRQLFPGVSIGGARYPVDAVDSRMLLRCADIALQRAKDTGRGRFVLFDEGIKVEMDRRDWIETELRIALSKGHLHVAYQPQIRIQGEKMVGAEALVRWTHPSAGSIAPDEFLSVAAERGLISGVTRSVVASVARDMSSWRRAGLACGKISINLHPLDLRSPADLLGCLQAFAEDRISPRNVILEVPEGCIVGRGTESAPLVLDALSEHGYEISLDDFGAGFASLSHLQRLPISEIKIDRSFIAGLTSNAADRAIVSAAGEIARVMELRVIAEGVETHEQRRALERLGIEIAQGFYWSKPLDQREFEAVLRGNGLVSNGRFDEGPERAGHLSPSLP
jgi:diguanylate cyclase